MKILITEDQLKTIAIPFFTENKIKGDDHNLELQENWSKLNKKQRELVLELYKIIHPEKSKQLNERFMDWVQGGLDVVGIFDPTGIADLTNAVLYFGRGETLFGMLSLVSIIPAAGDAIAKPIILGGKALGLPFKAFKAAVATGDATKIAKSAKAMEKLGPVGKKIVEFIESFGKGMGKQITNLLEKGRKIPVVGRFFKTIQEWIKVFEKAATEIKLPTKQLRNVKGQFAGRGTDFKELFRQMGRPFDKNFGTTVFREMAKKGKFKFLGGEFTKIWKVPANRKLLGKTKLFLRFLDHLNVGNYIGPDELLQQEPNAEEKFTEYLNTPEGQAAFKEEFGNSSEMPTDMGDVSSTPSTDTKGKLGGLFSNMSPEQLGYVLGLKGAMEPETKVLLSQLLKTAI